MRSAARWRCSRWRSVSARRSRAITPKGPRGCRGSRWPGRRRASCSRGRYTRHVRWTRRDFRRRWRRSTSSRGGGISSTPSSPAHTVSCCSASRRSSAGSIATWWTAYSTRSARARCVRATRCAGCRRAGRRTTSTASPSACCSSSSGRSWASPIMRPPYLSLITWMPFVGALLIMFTARRSPLAVRLIGVVTTGISAALSLYLYVTYDREAALTETGFQFYELAVLPMYLLIGIWGSSGEIRPRGIFAWAYRETGVGTKEYAAMKLTLYLLFGSAFILVGIFALYVAAGTASFSFLDLSSATFDPMLQRWVFLAFYVGFGILAGIWPLHTWSPDGHASAPTAVSMLHAGVLMKLGAYGVVRLGMGLLPDGAADLAWL